MRTAWFVPLLAALLLGGCGGSTADGGGGVTGRGEVSGIVFDEEGAPARGVAVWYDGGAGGERRETVSNSTGAFTLTSLPANGRGIDVLVRAETTLGGTRYVARNLATLYVGERTKNLNLALIPSGKTASIYGQVEDSSGYLLQGVRVFARQRDGAVPTSSYGITDGDGNYRIDGLRANVAYDIQANGYGYATDWAYNVTLNTNQSRRMDFSLQDGGDPALPAPENLIATAWTSPREVTRDAQQVQAIEAIKNHLKPNRKNRAKTRDAVNGYPIEVDLEWDPMGYDSMLGYGVYRGTSVSNLKGIEFLRDPLAFFFADSDTALMDNRTYVYGVSAINTTYDDFGGESEGSNTVSVRTLGPLVVAGVSGNEIDWNTAAGAQEYVVYIFDSYPTMSPLQIRHTSPSLTSTFYDLDGLGLASGRTYYAMVVGIADEGSSLTVSKVVTFKG